jgi:hypothetical protein
MEASKLFTGEVTFRDSSDVTADVTGDPDTAGFVQVMQGRSSDPERARELMAQNPDDWAAFRPDVIGSVAVGHQGGAYTMALYFTSEQAAREGERKEPPPQLKALMEQINQLMAGEPEFLDLRQPWLYSPWGAGGQSSATGRRSALSPERSQPHAHRTIHRGWADSQADTVAKRRARAAAECDAALNTLGVRPAPWVIWAATALLPVPVGAPGCPRRPGP